MHLFNHFANITIPYVFKITCMDCDLLQPCITNKENKLNDKKNRYRRKLNYQILKLQNALFFSSEKYIKLMSVNVVVVLLMLQPLILEKESCKKPSEMRNNSVKLHVVTFLIHEWLHDLCFIVHHVA